FRVRPARPAVGRVRGGSRGGGRGVVRRALPGGPTVPEPRAPRDLHASAAAPALPLPRLAGTYGLAAHLAVRPVVHGGACRPRPRHAAHSVPAGGMVDLPAAALRHNAVRPRTPGGRAAGVAGCGARAPAAAVNRTIGDLRALDALGPGAAAKDRRW